MRPFSWEVWGALMAACCVVPLILFVVENIMQTGRLPVGVNLLVEW